MEKHICDYGCGKDANFYFKNVGKWCCSKNVHSCDKVRKNIGEKLKGKIAWNEGKINIYNQETLRKMADSKRGKKQSKDHIENARLTRIGKHRSIETKKKISIGNKKPKMSEKFKEEQSKRMRNGGYFHVRKFYTEESKEKQRQYMLNGGVLKARKGMKKISKAELKLRNIVKELYSNCEFQFPIFNYALDIALADHKIAIEYDGYYHFDSEEHKQYHKLRQEKIETEGWKFLRYTIFDKFPSEEQIKKDIQRIIHG